MKQCQSCGMPLYKDPSGQGWWTEKEGSISQTYCSLCYRDGVFCYTGSDLTAFQNIVDDAMKKQWFGRFMRTLTRWQIPHLARRKQQKSKKLRFKRKSYGRGRTPASRQWRLVIGFYIVCITLLSTLYLGTHNVPATNTMLWKFAGWVIIATIALLRLCYQTWESPKRQWGEEKK